MTQSDDYLTLRESFPPPVPERELAADLLDEAANCLLSHSYEEGREQLRLADMATVSRYANRIMGAEDLHVHRRRVVAAQPKGVDKAGTRMPRLLWRRKCTLATVGAAAFADAVSY